MRLLTLLALVLASSAAFAAPKPEDQGWLCGTPDFVNDLVVDRGDLRLNNFLLSEGDSETWKGARAINASFSAVNRGSLPLKLSTEMVGFDKAGMPVFALSTSSGYGSLGTKSASQVGSGTYAQRGDLARTAKVCFLAISGSPEAN